MKAIFASYARGLHHVNHKYGIIHIDGLESKAEAAKLLGKTVSWTSPGKGKKVLTGKITSTHGNKGRVCAHFEHGLPGQALGTELKIE